ncbi:MAG: DM9 repeat-containing protein [Akkermansiaceae bacterium]|nr:DUF3421 domain-containing protein [Luteolibacter sp.]
MHAEEIDKALLEALESDSFRVREKATKDLIDSKLTIAQVEQLIAAAEGPETRHRLGLVLLGKYELIGWVKIPLEDIPKRAKPCGTELPENKSLYLVKAQHEGSDVIGKYLTEWPGGNFPVGEVEVMINDFQVWIGKGVWRKWDVKSAKKIPMGKTKEGKSIYAVRAEHQNGTHPGTMVEGETKARISWGGSVVHLENFEILESE